MITLYDWQQLVAFSVEGEGNGGSGEDGGETGDGSGDSGGSDGDGAPQPS